MMDCANLTTLAMLSFVWQFNISNLKMTAEGETRTSVVFPLRALRIQMRNIYNRLIKIEVNDDKIYIRLLATRHHMSNSRRDEEKRKKNETTKKKRARGRWSNNEWFSVMGNFHLQRGKKKLNRNFNCGTTPVSIRQCESSIVAVDIRIENSHLALGWGEREREGHIAICHANDNNKN